jgi:trimeric autotransporter adhesin
MSRRQRRTKEKRRRHAPAHGKRIRNATLSGSLAATAALGGLATDADTADAQGTFDATLVKDINATASSDPKYLTNLGGSVFFQALDGPDDGTTHGDEFWRSDGTEAGTQLVKDINPTGNSVPRGFTSFGGNLIFAANDGATGQELWRSNGTDPGTYLVNDINSAGGSNPNGFAAAGGSLFFQAYDGMDNGTTQHGSELWKTDGTHPYTVLVKDINASGNSFPQDLTNVNGTLFFRADDGTNGAELWMSDGNPGGTTMIDDDAPADGGINPGANASNPTYLTSVGGTLFFAADDGTNGRELWRSDGTAAGTYMVKNINTAGDGAPGNLTNVGGTLFFRATDGPDNGTTHGYELWKSTGTGPGTELVKDIDASGDSTPISLANSGGRLFFSADDGATGRELWRSDGTGPGTQLVKDIDTGDDSPMNGVPDGSYPSRLTDVNGTLFLAANDGATGQELWRSDGTGPGTQLVEDIDPGDDSPMDGMPDGSEPKYLTNLGGTVLFNANDGTTGDELWKAFALPGGGAAVTPVTPVPSNQFSQSGKKLNKKKGTATLTFTLPGAGQLSAEQEGGGASVAAKKRRGGKLIKPTSVAVPGAGPATITIRASKAGKAILKRKGKLRVPLRVTFTPTGGSPNSQTAPLLLKLD